MYTTITTYILLDPKSAHLQSTLPDWHHIIIIAIVVIMAKRDAPVWWWTSQNKLLQPTERLSRINRSRAPTNLFYAWCGHSACLGPQAAQKLMVKTKWVCNTHSIGSLTTSTKTKMIVMVSISLFGTWSKGQLPLLQEKKVGCKKTEIRCVVWACDFSRLVKDSIGSLTTSTKTKMIVMVSISLFGTWSLLGSRGIHFQ